MSDNLKEREAFEAWATDRSWPISHDGLLYEHGTTQSMWAGWKARASIEADRVSRDVPAVPDELCDDDLSELAHSANQEALSFGLSHDVFLRYFKTIRNRALAAAPQPQPVAQPVQAQPLDPWSVEEDYFAWVTTSATTWDAFLAGVRLAENAHSIKPANQQKE